MLIAVTPNLTRLLDALDVTELTELSDSRLTLRSCSVVADDGTDASSVSRLTGAVTCVFDSNPTAGFAVGLALAATLAGAADTLATGANKP